MTRPDGGQDASSDRGDLPEYYFSCPWCGNSGRFRRIEPTTDDVANGCSLALLTGLFGLLYLPWLLGAKVLCDECGFVFRKPALSRGPLAHALRWALVLIFVSGLLGAGLEIYNAVYPDVIGARYAQIAHQHALGLGGFFVFVAAIVLPYLLIAFYVTSMRWRRALRQRLRTEVPKCRPEEKNPDRG